MVIEHNIFASHTGIYYYTVRIWKKSNFIGATLYDIPMKGAEY